MKLSQLTAATFEPHLGKQFSVLPAADAEQVTFTLAKVTPSPHADSHPESERDPFSLLFHSKTQLDQGTFQMTAEGLDAMDLLTVPVAGPTDECEDYSYQVVFG